MNNVIISVADWQMQCCGAPFKVGERVEWTVDKKEEPNEVWDKFDPEPIEYYYENHASDQMKTLVLEGLVKKIYANYFKFEIKLKRQHKFQAYKEYSVPIAVKSVTVDEADGWHNEMDTETWKFVYYTVHLDDVEVKA